VWNIHGPNAKSFEERYPGFAAWRQQHKGVPTDTTLGAGEAAAAAGSTGGGGGRGFGRRKRRKMQ